MGVGTLADRPDLFEAVFSIPYDPRDGAAFMQHHEVAVLTCAERLRRRWPDHVIAILDHGSPVARAVTVPFAADCDGRCLFPAGGWEQVNIWAAEDAMDDRPVDTMVALEIAVDPERRGQGLSNLALAAVTANAARLGLRLVAPVRPIGKADYPNMSMDDYVARTRPDGLPADPWLRAHVRAGGTFVTTAPCSATVAAKLDDWRAWTGLPFDTSGNVSVPGALAPVVVVLERNLGIYVEPNAWFRYDTADD